MTVRSEAVAASAVEAYRGTFASGEPERRVGDALPPGWEGITFPFAVPMADLRPDGTPARDGVLPPVELPRRMYAGEETRFLRPVAIGEEVEQITTLGEVVDKHGSSGRLVFVDIVREWVARGEVAIRSVWHDVFLEAAAPGAPARPPRRDPGAAATADWVEEVVLDARQLFRFSALTFNTHLVHYDRAWARDEEGLPDLLVHGPLTRMLLMDAARRRVPGRTAASLTVRSVAPAYVDRPLRLAGSTDGERTTVIALDADDVVVATAEVRWA